MNLAEAARVDGCSEFRIFWNIYLPLILPAAVTLGIMTFQSGWNSFMWPMIVLNSKEMMISSGRAGGVTSINITRSTGR